MSGPARIGKINEIRDLAGRRTRGGGLITFHGFRRTPLAVGHGSFPIVAHAEDQMPTRPGALEHV